MLYKPNNKRQWIANDMKSIRKYRPGDQEAMYHVCLKTGDHGNDGEPFYTEDPDALARIYTGPYVHFSPDFALIIEDDEGLCGYALGVLDTHEFYERYDREWRPDLIEQFTDPKGDPAKWSRVEKIHHQYHHPNYFCPEPYSDYPAHLHIDLLPRAQGQGYGRSMIEQLLDLLRKAGAPGVHLEMSAKNVRAYGFYKKLGFQELIRDDENIYMGIKLQ